MVDRLRPSHINEAGVIPETHEPPQAVKYAFAFPGQGSQSIGMAEKLYNGSRAARDIIDEADEILGFELSKLMFKGPGELLEDTINAQPAILVASIAGAVAMRESLGDKTPKPSVLIGHSLGEYTAVVIAGGMSFKDGVNLVRERGRLMKEEGKNRPGGMAAIQDLSLETLEEICRETDVEIGNDNYVGQLIITGDKVRIAQAVDLALNRGAKRATQLKVSGAFHHSVLMSGVQNGLRDAIFRIDLKDPKIPIVANSNCEVITTAEQIRNELIKGVCKRVLWRGSIQEMVKMGVTHFVEIGPRKTLTAFIKRIEEGVRTFNIDSPESVQQLAVDLAF